MQERTVAAKLIVYDKVTSGGQHFTENPFTPRLKRNVKAAKMRYNQHLHDQRKAKGDNEKQRRRFQDELNEVEKRNSSLRGLSIP